MAGYAVEPTQLQRCDVLLRDTAAHSRAALTRLRSSAHEVLDGWEGGAGAAARLGWAHWVDGAVDMLDALDEMALALGRSAQGYATTDETVRAAAAGLQA